MWSGPNGPGLDGPAVQLWSFGYACMLWLDGVPAVVRERLAELDPGNLVPRYLGNVRRARGEGRL